MTLSASERLAGFAAELSFAVIPAPVIAKAKLHLLDLIGVALAASGLEFGCAAVGVARRLGGEGSCTAIGSAVGMPGVWAALANGTLGHGLDYDDTHLESVVHVSAGVAPAALAAAEQTGAGGRGLLAALVLGLETSVRIGLAARGGFHDRGFHPTGICNAFAAALLAGQIIGLSEKKLADAIGIAGSQAAGSLEFLTDGADAKRIHGGWAAHAGMVAAELARGGFTGPRGILEGRFGLYRSHLGEGNWDAGRVTAGLGEHWECLNIGLKPYPCCHYNHAFIDAAAALRREHRIALADVAAVECLVAEREIPVVCEPEATKRTPQTDYDAKFSLPYAVASMLVRGRVDIDDFTSDAIRDPAVLSLSQRVSYVADPAADFPRRFGGTVRIRLKDGRSVERAEPVNRGSAERPLTAVEVREKFGRNAGRVCTASAAEAIAAAVDGLDRAESLHTLAEALRAAGRVLSSA